MKTTGDLKIDKVWFDTENIYILVSDGTQKSHPLRWFPRLGDATPKQREKYELGPLLDSIHWPELDEDLSLEGFFSYDKDEIDAKKSEIQKILGRFPELNVNELARRIGISPTLMRHYACNVKQPSAERTRQIIEALHQVGRELQAI
jgi:hypothetical protein